MDGADSRPRGRTPVIVVAAAILAVGLATFLFPSSATYDAWSWIVWGREIVHGELNTVSGPSWKPLPVVVTTIAAPFGSIAPDVWVLAARLGAITGVVLAFLIARRLGGLVAGVFAAVSLGAAPWWVWNGWLANSEGLLVAVVLGAVLAELDGRRRVAFACGIAAGLLRPEAWPFVLLYALWLAWRGDGRERALIAAGLAILPLAWLLPEKWGSGDYWRAASRAQNPDPGAASLTDFPAWTVTKDFFTMLPTATWAIAAAALVLGVVGLIARRRGDGGPALTATRPLPGTLPPDRAARVAVAIAVFGVAWLAIVVVLTTRGFSGNERYLIPPVALLLVAASAGFGLLLARVPRGPRVALVAIFVVLIAIAAIDDVPRQLRSATYESRLVDDLPKAIASAGGAERIARCADVSTHKFMVPQAAWYLDRPLEQVGMIPQGPAQVVLRLRLQQNGGWTPTVSHIPGLRSWSASPYWWIVAACDGAEAAR
ncbi:MAG: hypothetical protein ITG02_08430 [Patulibacter sp.]|nr:hypothetical protein [Patulibacter sp.]